MSDSELKALLELLAMLLFDWRHGVLFVLLIAAAVLDYRFHRIPNWLVLSGTLFGVFYNMAYPPFPQSGLLWSLEGWALGLAAFLPLYALSAMGAGDVKLMAMVGAFIGPGNTGWVLLYTLITGGFLSILFVLMHGTAGRMFRNLSQLFQLGLSDLLSGVRPDLRIATRASAGKLPYGIAIAMGTMAYLILHPLGWL
jgi:prepilin peptidase CpaA